MAKYTSLPAESDFAIQVLNDNYDYFNQNFLTFFKELKNMVDIEITA
jgi:hypothetical protein